MKKVILIVLLFSSTLIHAGKYICNGENFTLEASEERIKMTREGKVMFDSSVVKSRFSSNDASLSLFSIDSNSTDFINLDELLSTLDNGCFDVETIGIDFQLSNNSSSYMKVRKYQFMIDDLTSRKCRKVYRRANDASLNGIQQSLAPDLIFNCKYIK